VPKSFCLTAEEMIAQVQDNDIASLPWDVPAARLATVVIGEFMAQRQRKGTIKQVSEAYRAAERNCSYPNICSPVETARGKDMPMP
jgi:hypothetical protein